MAKFNQANTMKTVNKCGHVAYKMGDKEKLVSMALTTMFNENKFYGDNSNELVKLAEKSDMAFVAKLATYARRVMNLRSVSHVLACVVARFGGGQLTRHAISGVVIRPDDITEIMSCYKAMYGKPFPNAMKRQIAIEMNKFNDMSFAKYNGKCKGIKFKDVLKITHARPINAKSEKAFNDIINDTLPIPHNWETVLSEKGNTKEAWEELIESNDIGYMAMLRNLRNILKVQPKNIDKVFDKIADPNEVHKSRQLPFRFYSAYKNVLNYPDTNEAVYALEKAILSSCDNIEKIKGKTLIAIDCSGSMGWALTNHSDVKCYEIASIIGSIASKVCEKYEVVTFDTSLHHPRINKMDGIISNANRMAFHGGGTDITLPFEYITTNKKQFDRVILLSDNEINRYYRTSKTCQAWADKYRKEVNPNLWVHAIDLMGYGTQQFIGDKTNIIAGWSERVLEFINYAENGVGNLITAIEEYSL